MTDETFPATNQRLSLKEATGWFAAGDAFRKALVLLSDGAFRLFAYLCLEADRPTGRLRATHKELATALKKSKRIIGTYVAELEAGGVCHVRPGKNQFAGTIFESICLAGVLGWRPVGRINWAEPAMGGDRERRENAGTVGRPGVALDPSPAVGWCAIRSS